MRPRAGARGVRIPALLAAVLVAAGCVNAPPTAPAPEPGSFHLTLLGATPSTQAMRWNVALANGNDAALQGIHLSIAVKYYRTKDAGHDEKVVDVAANTSVVVLLNTTYLGFGDYDYEIRAVAADGTVLDGESDLFELCLC